MSEQKAEDQRKDNSKASSCRAITVLSIYLLLSMILILYSLVLFWAAPFDKSGSIFPIIFFTIQFDVLPETRLILIVLLSGALGSQIHALRSFFKYVGNRSLKNNWILMYIMLPFTGGALALIFYFVIRAGFISVTATPQEFSLYGIAATSALVGLFVEEAMSKLKKVAATLFEAPKPGKDSLTNK